jgi:hypothetical protein
MLFVSLLLIPLHSDNKNTHASPLYVILYHTTYFLILDLSVFVMSVLLTNIFNSSEKLIVSFRATFFKNRLQSQAVYFPAISGVIK